MKKEPFCEPIFRRFRIRRVSSYINSGTVLLDAGCGVTARFLKDISPFIKSGFGIDKKAEPFERGNLKIVEGFFDGEPFPYPDASFDCVTMLAVLEHMANRREVLEEIYRVLRPGGVLLATTPSWAAKPVLEFLSFRMGVVNKEEVLDHKTYFWKSDLVSLMNSAGFKDVHHKYFQFGFSNFVRAVK